MVLFPETDDAENIRRAVQSGEIPKERLKDALMRILRMKEKAGLFKEEPAITQESIEEFKSVAQQIADKSITIVKDEKRIIPSVKKGVKF